MDLDYITMKNFRQYLDTRIDFARTSPKNFTVIEGVNGAGKTNLMNAITWCLFGEEYHIGTKYAGLPMVNTTALEGTCDSTIEVKVEIQFIEKNNDKLVVIRLAHFKKKEDDSTLKVPFAHFLSVMQQIGREWIGPNYDDEAQEIIDNRIPPSIEEYFFFDGERMDEYFKENTGKEIKTAVFQISQLELFKRLIEHLEARRSEFLKTARGLSSRAEEIRELFDTHTMSLETDKQILEELKQKKQEAESLERLYSEKLKNSTLEHIQQLEDTRQSLDSDISDTKQQILEIENAMIESLHKAMPVIFAYGALEKTRNLIEGRIESGLIPPVYQKIFIENLIKKEKCICGSDLSKKDEYSTIRRKNVELFLEPDPLSIKSKEVIEANTAIRKMMEDIIVFPVDILELEQRMKRTEENKEAKEQKVKKIEEEIQQSNIENIKIWEQEREKYSTEKDRLIGEIAKTQTQKDKRTKIIAACQSELKRELEKEDKHKALSATLELCSEGIKCAEEIKDQIMKNVKDEIEMKTSQQFLALIWKKDTYTGVRIDDDYNMSVPHVSGREALGTLSAGERQVCALSFMAALNSVSGFEVPIVIDTPLARISSEPSRNIAKNLPNYLKDKQVTLLMTEKEYAPEVNKELSDRVGMIYTINVIEKPQGNLAEVKLIK
jgi:DNA sulfur modification protein DndD